MSRSPRRPSLPKELAILTSGFLGEELIANDV